MKKKNKSLKSFTDKEQVFTLPPTGFGKSSLKHNTAMHLATGWWHLSNAMPFLTQIRHLEELVSGSDGCENSEWSAFSVKDRRSVHNFQVF